MTEQEIFDVANSYRIGSDSDEQVLSFALYMFDAGRASVKAAPSQEPLKWGEPICKTDDTQLAELDALRNDYQEECDENAILEVKLNDAAAQIAELEKRLDREIMCHAACGVVAMANTRESAKEARQMKPEYYSASVQDVARAVDAEMDYREQIAKLEAAIERMRVAGGSHEFQMAFELAKDLIKPIGENHGTS